MALEVVRHSCVVVCVMSLCLILRASACVCLCVGVPGMLLCDSMHLEKGVIMLLLRVRVLCMAACICFSKVFVWACR